MAGEEVLSFFFSEFPEEYGAKEMFEIFADFGLVVEVVIPPKRDKRGKRYGFVRFRKVRDARLLEAELDNICIKDKKIHANVPRFQRGGGHTGDKGRDDIGRGGEISKPEWRILARDNTKSFQAMTAKTNGGGYAEVVKRNKAQHPGLQNQKNQGWNHKELKPKFAHLQFNMEESEMKRFAEAFVGVVEVPGSTYNIQGALHAEGHFSIKATQMGANLCLLEEMEEGDLVTLIREEPEWFGKWFSDIHPWTPEDVDNERLTWIRVCGLPCHAWKKEFFEFISKTVGVFVCIDEETKNHTKLDVARFLIRTKYLMNLNESINVGVNENFYSIKLVEDMHGPKRLVASGEASSCGQRSCSSETADDSWEEGDTEADEEDGEWSSEAKEKVTSNQGIRDDMCQSSREMVVPQAKKSKENNDTNVVFETNKEGCFDKAVQIVVLPKSIINADVARWGK
ncbi:uncharacterized protein LOC131649953 [Vicia villosa]|uniref:uncharacterized protein LOC131649953 n=1 Tax=Vicia villosa TaxID=3911 RepID=UPI00273C960A|nr:uncharacterized protein LOC131649953 [Vicia villosa]